MVFIAKFELPVLVIDQIFHFRVCENEKMAKKKKKKKRMFFRAGAYNNAVFCPHILMRAGM